MLKFPKLDYVSAHPFETITAPEVRLYQVLMQNFANEIMRYLAKAGSRLRVFDSDPSFSPDVSSAADSNGHIWPVYTYRRGCVTDASGSYGLVANQSAVTGVDEARRSSYLLRQPSGHTERHSRRLK
jgi:hypothetical protein